MEAQQGASRSPESPSPALPPFPVQKLSLSLTHTRALMLSLHLFPFPLVHSCSPGRRSSNFIAVYHEQFHRVRKMAKEGRLYTSEK